MRKTLLTLLFLSFVYISKAQQTLPSLNYVPQAPITAAFTRYGDIPVDLSTGVTNISIPIYTLNERGFNIPISISYHASGIKVSDIASSVGLGWTLNAGGVITRTVMGLKDEQLDMIDGSGQHTFSKPPFRNELQFDEYSGQREAQDQFNWFNEIFNQYINVAPGTGMYDFYSDRFYYNLGTGESGVFRKDFMNDDFKTIPYTPIKIRFLNEFVRSFGFDIEMTTTNGTRYLFRGGKYALWHPDKIINNSGTDSVVFYSHSDTIAGLAFSNHEEFGTYKNTQNAKIDYVINHQSNLCALYTQVNNAQSNIIRHGELVEDEAILIDSIVGPNTVIRFAYARDRVDAQTINFGVLSRLTGVQVVNRQTGVLIKNFDLSQIYSEPNQSDASRRLLLAGIQTGANGQEKYEFKYNPLPLPDYFMKPFSESTSQVYEQDFWGYYKGGPISYSTLFSDFSPNGAPDLFPKENMAQACMLQEIKYPTGGKTVFEYESNRVPSYFYGPGFSSPNVPTDGKVGGLRIKKISNYAYEGAVPQVKSYEYICNLSKEYGYLDTDRFTYYQQTLNYWNEVLAQCGAAPGTPSDVYLYTYANICLEKPFGRYIGSPQAPVYYNQVTEYNGDANKNTGKTVYCFHLPDDILNDIGPGTSRFCGPWDKDLGSYLPALEKKEEYKNEDGSYKLVRKTETEYTQLHFEPFYTGFNLSSDVQINPIVGTYYNSFIMYLNNVSGFYRSTLHYSSSLGYPGLRLPWKTNVYDYIDSNNYVNTHTEYSYNDQGQQIAATTTTSKGDALTTKFTYPVDYATVPPYNTMVEKNILTPVIEQSTYKNTTNFLQSTKINYNYWNYASQTWGSGVSNQILPQTIETQKGTSNKETRVRYYSYDDKDNPMVVAKENDTRQMYLWAYNKTYPVSQVVNVPESERVAYTSFEDAYSGFGVIDGNWLINGNYNNVTVDPSAPTGSKCFKLGSLTGLSGNIPSSSNYILSYWYKSGSSITVSANSNILLNSTTKNGWVFEKRKITGAGGFTIRGNGYIDEVRFYPESAQMISYAYEPGIGMTAQCDVNDRISHYTYDAAGRLTLVKDEDGNVLKKICYNFQGQPDVCGENALALWQPTGVTRCKPCRQNPIYFTNITQAEEKDNNSNSDSYGATRWVDIGVLGGVGACSAEGDWQPTGNVRCKTLGGQNTGEQLKELKDMNPCTNTAGDTIWVSAGTNTAACPMPAVFQSLDVSGNYYKQGCGAQQVPLPFYVSMPQGAYNSSTSTEDATNQARAEAQRQANANGQCVTVYIRMVKIPKPPTEDQQLTDYKFNIYSDAAGTISLTLPVNLIINVKFHSYWLDNGTACCDEGTYDSQLNPMAGQNNYLYPELESTFCPYEGWCRQQEMIIQPGQYVIIP